MQSAKHLWLSLWNWILVGLGFKKCPPPVLKKTPVRRDRVPLSPEQIDYIRQCHADWKAHNRHNPGKRISMDQLVNDLNRELGFTKSKRTYSRVWSRKEDFTNASRQMSLPVLPRPV